MQNGVVDIGNKLLWHVGELCSFCFDDELYLRAFKLFFYGALFFYWCLNFVLKWAFHWWKFLFAWIVFLFILWDSFFFNMVQFVKYMLILSLFFIFRYFDLWIWTRLKFYGGSSVHIDNYNIDYSWWDTYILNICWMF